MAKILKEYKEYNKWGEYTVKEYSNGIKTKSLVKPSEKYIEKNKKRNIEKQRLEKEKKKIKEREKLIQDRMKEIAIRELKEEGKI